MRTSTRLGQHLGCPKSFSDRSGGLPRSKGVYEMAEAQENFAAGKWVCFSCAIVIRVVVLRLTRIQLILRVNPSSHPCTDRTVGHAPPYQRRAHRKSVLAADFRLGDQPSLYRHPAHSRSTMLLAVCARPDSGDGPVFDCHCASTITVSDAAQPRHSYTFSGVCVRS